MMATIDSRQYYSTYFGHEPELLEALHEGLRRPTTAAANDNNSDPPSPRPCIFLAGDSSLDNKVWFENRAPACNGYEDVLEPSLMKMDV